jgi:hypothetical protein
MHIVCFDYLEIIEFSGKEYTFLCILITFVKKLTVILVSIFGDRNLTTRISAIIKENCINLHLMPVGGTLNL